jgi:hypothetical protein
MNSDADNQIYEAILASLRVWILSIAAALLELFGKHGRIKRSIARILYVNLRAAEYDAKRALFLLAIARLPPHDGKPRVIHARVLNLKRRKCSHFRLLTHGSFNARPTNLRARIDRLRDMLENSEGWIARLLARLSRCFDGMHRILAAPPVARTYLFATPALSAADSS